MLCPVCQQPPRPRMATAMQWPNPTGRFERVPSFIHSINYFRGPTPWIDVRRKGENAFRLYLGDTVELDCESDWECRPAFDAADLSVVGPGLSTVVPHQVELLLDCTAEHRTPGLFRLAYTVTVASTSGNALVLNVPIEGIQEGMIHMEAAAGFGVGLTATPQVRGRPPGTQSSQPTAAITAFTAAGNYRGVVFGEDGRFGVTGPINNRLPGLYERLEIFFAGSGTLSGNIAIAIMGRRYDR